MAGAIIASGRTLELMFSDDLFLYAPDFLEQEFIKHREEFLHKSKLSKEEFELVAALLFSRLQVISHADVQEFIVKADRITPDKDDLMYFALALNLHCPIWSNDKRLKDQKDVRILSTQELIKELNPAQS